MPVSKFAENQILIDMKKIIKWLGANNTYCAAYAGVGVAAALELKDELWGGKWDWIDFGCTVAGVVVGRLIRWAVWQ